MMRQTNINKDNPVKVIHSIFIEIKLHKNRAYSSSIMISKEQVKAPVGHTASQVVHQ
jgi:hypothetical protein